MLSHSSKGEKPSNLTTRECNIETVTQAGENKALERWRREWEREKERVPFTGFPAAMADSNLCLHLSFPSSPLSSTPLSGWNTQIWTVTQSLTKEGKTLANNANLGFPENKPDLHDFLFSWASPTQSAAYEPQSASAKCSRPEQCMMGRLCKKRPTAFGTPSICPYNHGSSLFDSFQ